MLMLLREAEEDSDHHGTKSNTTLTILMDLIWNGVIGQWAQ